MLSPLVTAIVSPWLLLCTVYVCTISLIYVKVLFVGLQKSPVIFSQHILLLLRFGYEGTFDMVCIYGVIHFHEFRWNINSYIDINTLYINSTLFLIQVSSNNHSCFVFYKIISCKTAGFYVNGKLLSFLQLHNRILKFW